MEANVLRFVLLILGVAFVVGIYLWERRKREARQVHAVRREPEMSAVSLDEAAAGPAIAADADEAIDFDLVEEGVRLRPSRSRAPSEMPPPKTQSPAPGDGAPAAAERIQAPAERITVPAERITVPAERIPAPAERIPVPAWALKKPAGDTLERDLGQLDALVKESAPQRRSDHAARELPVPPRPVVAAKDAAMPSGPAAAATETPAQPPAEAMPEVTVGAPPAPVPPSPTPAPDAGGQIAFPFLAEDDSRQKAKKKEKDKEKEKDKGRKKSRAESEPAEFPAPVLPQLPPKILVINVVAKREPFAGEAILDAVQDLGLCHGDMGIYHRHDQAGGGKTVFSMASMVKPGSFPVDKMDAFATPGLSLFTQLPGPRDGQAMFNDMLTAAEQLAKRLGGELQDDTHSVLTRQTIEHLRGEVVEYQRRLRLVRRPA